MNRLRLAKQPESEVEVPTPPVWTQRDEDQRLRALAINMAMAGSPFVRRISKFNPDSSLRTPSGYAPAVTVFREDRSLTHKLLNRIFRIFRRQ